VSRAGVTDTHGNCVPRLSKKAISGVLQRLVEMTAGGRRDYAMVYCETHGLGLIRCKGQPQEYSLHRDQQLLATFAEQASAVEAFWKLYRTAEQEKRWRD